MRRRSPRRQPTMAERFGADAIAPERRLRPERLGVAVRGLARLVLVLTIAAGASTGLGLLLGAWRDWPAGRSVAYGLYLGGAALVVVAFNRGGPLAAHDTGGHQAIEAREPAAGRIARHAEAWGYLLLGIAVVALGVVVELRFG